MTLEATHICKQYGTHRVLDDVSLRVDVGQCLGLLGSNGAGKTTLLHIITLLTKPDSGRLLFEGHDMSAADLQHIGYLPEERGLYRNMRAGEQAVYLLRLKGMTRSHAQQQLRTWFQRMGIADCWDMPTSKLSKGMHQRLQIAVCVAHEPRLLLLDEPFSGLDDTNAAMLRSQIASLKQQGTAIILSTHNLSAAAELCDTSLQL